MMYGYPYTRLVITYQYTLYYFSIQWFYLLEPKFFKKYIILLQGAKASFTMSPAENPAFNHMQFRHWLLDFSNINDNIYIKLQNIGKK